MVQLILQRFASKNGATMGILLDPVGEFVCFTLEDKQRQVKVAGETCIPDGIYEIKVTLSEKFDRFLLELLDVPGFTGIRIHRGNQIGDTMGCILVGMGASLSGDPILYDSKNTEIVVLNMIEKLLEMDKVFISVFSFNCEIPK